MNEIREVLEKWEVKTYTLEMDTGGVLSHKVQKLSEDTIADLVKELSAIIKDEGEVKKILDHPIEWIKGMKRAKEGIDYYLTERCRDKLAKAICSRKCPECGGRGYFADGNEGITINKSDCPTCQGTGCIPVKKMDIKFEIDLRNIIYLQLVEFLGEGYEQPAYDMTDLIIYKINQS